LKNNIIHETAGKNITGRDITATKIYHKRSVWITLQILKEGLYHEKSR